MVEAGDREWVRSYISERWGADYVVVHGRVYSPHELPGCLAEDGAGNRVGLATYCVEGPSCELVTLNSDLERAGTGTALLARVIEIAREAGCRRLWLITTNDNMAAIRFYQKRGFRLVAVHRDALDLSRRLKPSIPAVGNDGIPLLDEIEMELNLLPEVSTDPA
jgi:GNAT superfamily N-acetyltransferase